jgi:sucrose-phosphate synthase
MVGAKRHYSWEHHVDRYLRDLGDIVEHVPRPALTSNARERAIPSFDRLIITDLDNTLTGDDASLAELLEILKQHHNIGFGIATGRRLDSALELIEQLNLPIPELISTDVGTQLHYGRKMTEDRSWRKQIGHEWKPDAIRACLDSQPGFYQQADENQSEFKISYEIDPEKSPTVPKIQKLLRAAGLRAKVVLSLGMYLDVIPVRGGSDLAMRHLLWKWGFPPEHVLVAGDSGNDAGMLQGRTLGVVVGNYSPELERLRNWPRIYFAQAAHAAGIIEGIHYYNFLDQPRIPNERDD